MANNWNLSTSMSTAVWHQSDSKLVMSINYIFNLEGGYTNPNLLSVMVRLLDEVDMFQNVEWDAPT